MTVFKCSPLCSEIPEASPIIISPQTSRILYLILNHKNELLPVYLWWHFRSFLCFSLNFERLGLSSIIGVAWWPSIGLLCLSRWSSMGTSLLSTFFIPVWNRFRSSWIFMIFWVLNRALLPSLPPSFLSISYPDDGSSPIEWKCLNSAVPLGLNSCFFDIQA